MNSKIVLNALSTRFLVLFFFYSGCFFAQNMVVEQDLKFDQLLQERKKLVSPNAIASFYKIQIYNGTNSDSKKALLDFKNQFKNQDATIVFSTPLYKVWVGSYKTRIDAERNLGLLRKKYPNALLIKPSN